MSKNPKCGNDDFMLCYKLWTSVTYCFDASFVDFKFYIFIWWLFNFLDTYLNWQKAFSH